MQPAQPGAGELGEGVPQDLEPLPPHVEEHGAVRLALAQLQAALAAQGGVGARASDQVVPGPHGTMTMVVLVSRWSNNKTSPHNCILTCHCHYIAPCLSCDGGFLPSSSTDTGLERLFIQTFSFLYILLFSLMTDGVAVTSLLSRLDKLEIFLGKIFVILLKLCWSGDTGVPTLGEEG